MVTVSSFVKEWSVCKRCPLHKDARHHVLYRGDIPATVLMIGEAPGKTEDKLGKPFIGRSGQVLTEAIQRLGVCSYCIANVVCCIPWRNKQAGVIRPPSPEEAEACKPHITQLIQLCKPKLIVLLGEQAKKYNVTDEVPLTHLRHPAYILRNGGIGSLEYKRFLDAFHSALVEANIPCENPFQTIGA